MTGSRRRGSTLRKSGCPASGVPLGTCNRSSYRECVRDTSPTSQRRYEELLQQRTPAQRMALATSLSLAVRRLAIAGIRAKNPEASADDIRVELARRLYGDGAAEYLFRRA